MRPAYSCRNASTRDSSRAREGAVARSPCSAMVEEKAKSPVFSSKNSFFALSNRARTASFVRSSTPFFARPIAGNAAAEACCCSASQPERRSVSLSDRTSVPAAVRPALYPAYSSGTPPARDSAASSSAAAPSSFSAHWAHASRSKAEPVKLPVSYRARMSDSHCSGKGWLIISL